MARKKNFSLDIESIPSAIDDFLKLTRSLNTKYPKSMTKGYC